MEPMVWWEVALLVAAGAMAYALMAGLVGGVVWGLTGDADSAAVIAGIFWPLALTFLLTIGTAILL